MTAWIPAYLGAMQDYLSDPTGLAAQSMYGRWDAGTWEEGGVDLSSPAGTPVYALADGTIQGAGYFWHSSSIYTPNSGPPGNAVVTTRVNVPGYGPQDLYYQHIKLAPQIQPCMDGNCGGQVVHQGDILGWIEQDPGEVEMGFNADWGGIWGGSHPGTWATDPRPMIAALMGAGMPSTLGTQTGLGGLDITPVTNILSSLDPLWEWLKDPARVFKLVGGLLLVGISLYMLIAPDASSDMIRSAKGTILA